MAGRTAPAADAVAEVLAELAALGSEKNRAGMARYGINVEHAFGVSMVSLRPIARRLKRNHQLALALWDSGRHEARILAALIADPKQVSPALMDAWTADFDSWDLCDQVCSKLYARTPHAADKIRVWAADDREFVRRAAFALLAACATRGSRMAETELAGFLPLIERHAGDGRNFVRKAVNWALRQIGKRSVGLHAAALGVAERLASATDKSARWIGRDAVRELTDPDQRARLGLPAAG